MKLRVQVHLIDEEDDNHLVIELEPVWGQTDRLATRAALEAVEKFLMTRQYSSAEFV